MTGRRRSLPSRPFQLQRAQCKRLGDIGRAGARGSSEVRNTAGDAQYTVRRTRRKREPVERVRQQAQAARGGRGSGRDSVPASVGDDRTPSE